MTLPITLLALALVLVAGACGGSEDTVSAGDTDVGDIDVGDIDVGDLDLGDLDLDEELEAAIGEVIEDTNAGDGPDPSSPYAGIRIWQAGSVEEVLPGMQPDNLAPNPFDEYAGEGARWSFAGGPAYSTSDVRHVNLLVAADDWQWVVEGDGVRVSLATIGEGAVTMSVEAEDLLPGATISSIAGDANGIYVGLNHPAEDDFVVELDPITGVERGRVTLTGATPLYTLDSNGDYVTAVRRDGPGDENVDVIERASLEIAHSIPVGARLGTAMLTESEVLLVLKSSTASGPSTMERYSLADGSLLEDNIAMPGNGTVRSFGDVVVQFGDAADGEKVQVVPAGDTATAATIIDALPADVFGVGDLLLGDGFAAVTGCCGVDEYGSFSQRFWVVDLASGAVVLSSDFGGEGVAALTAAA